MPCNQYETYLRHVYEKGVVKTDRTGTGTRSVFGYQMRFNLQEGVPSVTTKKVHMKSIVHELIWFLTSDTNVKYLQENGVKIWDEWADANGDLGPVYGSQWRSWPGKVSLHRRDEFIYRGVTNQIASHMDADNTGVVAMQDGIDQIQQVIDTLKNNPDSRRIIVSAWNPAVIDQQKLPPCHCLFQFWTAPMALHERVTYAHENNMLTDYDVLDTPANKESIVKMLDANNVPKHKLSCQLYQRSCDSFLGVPFNIASYALLTEMVAQQVNMVADEFIWTGGDCHVYSNHYEQVETQLDREPYLYPTLKLNKAASIFDYKYEDVVIENYLHHEAIKAPVAV